ncbi:triphosphoribosyl-dephospho-CoA synthase [Duganella sp. CF458]|uniref:triphosphoribosyl-dephospho-CoA synthase MdcB n=1 Tax=Duganella sp. CF458 TaxID=1884368 RepID=UPI0008F4222E|nr:triphosphoribosyl-dephospho-CoA synthase MdcB [Duganella sp. CF458]SFF77054.1 triphosphoribosyl-dephospho-CoA synthase [Duganella sp. CF458]
MSAPASQAAQQARALAGAARLASGRRPCRHAAHALSREVALRAVRSLYHELALYPKPGLVSFIDNGSHADMNAATFMRSLFSLRHYYARICRAGYDGAPFAELKRLGIAAEQRMMAATNGINTHRGAIFALGLLCAAMGRVRALRMTLTPAALRTTLLLHWGDALSNHTHATGSSHGLQAAARHAASGAREEGALGLPSVFDVGLPALQSTLARGAPMLHARVDAIFALMAHVSDTNIYHRGGTEGADTVLRSARHFLHQGGTANPRWKEHALDCHRRFVTRRLSPGGAADLLAATCLVHSLTAMPPP